MFAEIISLWYVSGFLLLCPCLFVSTSEYRRTKLLLRTFQMSMCCICLWLGERSTSPCHSWRLSWRAWNPRSSPVCSTKLMNLLLTRTPALSPPKWGHLPLSLPFLAHLVPSRGSQGYLCCPSGGQCCLRDLPSLGCISCHPPFRHGALCSEKSIVKRCVVFWPEHTDSLSTPKSQGLHSEERWTHQCGIWRVLTMCPDSATICGKLIFFQEVNLSKSELWIFRKFQEPAAGTASNL